MPRVRCHYVDCVFLDDGFCSAGSIEVDPDEGCMTYKPASNLIDDEELEIAEEEEWEDLGFDEEDEDMWLDDEDYG